MTATTPETTVETLPYKNPDLPASERIADLLSRMTLEEKVGQMMQLDARGGDLDELIVNKHVGSILHTSPEDLPRAVETVNTKTRLGIPLVIGDDCIHGYSFWPGATIFPSQLGMALSWDPKAVEAAGRATAEEVSSTGVHWTFSPVLCIARDTRWVAWTRPSARTPCSSVRWPPPWSRAIRAVPRPVPTWAASRPAARRTVSITTPTTRSWMMTTRISKHPAPRSAA